MYSLLWILGVAAAVLVKLAAAAETLGMRLETLEAFDVWLVGLQDNWGWSLLLASVDMIDNDSNNVCGQYQDVLVIVEFSIFSLTGPTVLHYCPHTHSDDLKYPLRT